MVVRFPWAIIGVTLVATIAVSAFIPTIVADPSPEDMIASFEGQDTIRDAFQADFGNTDQITLLVIQSHDVLSRTTLEYVHRLTEHFRTEPFVSRVESLTAMPIPKPEAEDDPSLTLDALENEPEEDLPQDVLDAMLTLVDADPSRFPGGLAMVSDKRAELQPKPAVEGEHVTDADVAALRSALAEMPLVVGRLVDEEHHTTVVALALPTQSRERREAVAKVDAWLDAHAPPSGVTLLRGGLPHVRAGLVAMMRRDNRVLLPLTLVVCLLLLLASFRSFTATLLPLVTVGVSAAFTVGGMAIAHEPMTVLTNVIPPLLIIIGISDSIHLIGRFREELRERPGDRAGALHSTVKNLTTACFLTSLTTAIGIGSLVVSHTPAFRRFAVVASLGVMLAYVVTILFLPAALAKAKGPGPARPPRTEVLERSLAGLTVWVVRRPWRVLGITALIAGGAVFVSRGLSVDHALMDQFDANDPIARVTRVLEDRLEGVRPLEVSLQADDAAVFSDPSTVARIDRIERWTAEQPGILGVSTYTDVLHEVWSRLAGDPAARSDRLRTREQIDALFDLLRRSEHDPLSRFLASNGRHARMRIMVADVGAKHTMSFVDRLSPRLAHLEENGIRVTLTGEAYTGSVGTSAIVSDLVGSLSIAVVVIFVVLALLFRSIRLGLLSIPPNAIPLVGTTAWMVIRGIPLNLATAIIFSISIGLAVDGTIHVLARFREEKARGLVRSVALVRAARGTGRAIVVTCVTLMLGFGVLLLSSFVPVRHFGELIAVTAGLCLASTIVVQPALLRVGTKHE